MQQLQVNLSIPIPDDSVIITKVEYQKLKESELTGVYWGMADLEKRTGKKRQWLLEKMLYPERYRKKLDVKNGGFVYYPSSKGQAWSFHAKHMADFLDKHFAEIYKEI